MQTLLDFIFTVAAGVIIELFSKWLDGSNKR